ncbi:MAG: uracil-DNA glycosylase family protein [Gammaproteobacteria bacterium]|jgi:uracil-DNA glycosylase
MEWDKGPPPVIRQHFEAAPINEYQSLPNRFRLPWGPIYYRGRMDGSARILVIGQDPGPSESVARRIFVGTAGQRVQGFLKKLGITRSYVMVNALLYSIFGQFNNQLKDFSQRPAVETWRNDLLDLLVAHNPNLQLILTCGNAGKYVLENWAGAAPFRSQRRVSYLIHPTARPVSAVIENWKNRISRLDNFVTPDDPTLVDPTYAGTGFSQSDLADIPLHDFGFGAPEWMGTGRIAKRYTTRPPAGTDRYNTILYRATGDQG